MRLFIDSDSNTFITDAAFKAPLNSVSFKRGDASKVEIVFVSGNTPVTPSLSRSITLGIKEAGKYDGDFLVSTSSYTISGTSYVLSPSFNTVALNDLLNSGDTDDTNDVASVAAMLEITWSDDSGTTWLSTNTITANIANDVIKGSEGTAFELPAPVEWLEELRPAPLVRTTAPANGSSGWWATASILFNDNPPSGTSLTIGPHTYTWTPTPSGLFQIATAPNKNTSAGNLSIAINATPIPGVSYESYGFGPTLNFAAITAGTSGNSIPFTSAYSGFAISPFSGGLNPVAGTSGKLGQFAFVNATGAYVCSRENPVKWLAL